MARKKKTATNEMPTADQTDMRDGAMEPGTAVAPPLETKADKFKRLAIFRVNRALRALDSIAPLFNRVNYHYDAAQADAIAATIEEALDRLKVLATSNSAAKQQTFSF